MGKMTLGQYRTNLRLDLKDGGTLWENTEIDRCVERAVDDMSRLIPLEEVYETTLDFDVADESFTTLAASSATAIVNAYDISAVVNGTAVTLASKSLSQARPVLVTVTDVATVGISSFTIIVKGYDRDGQYIEESFYFRGGLVQTGVKYFKYISEVEVDEMTGESTGDTLSVGTASVNNSWINLANKPVKPESETVTNAAGTTTYTRGTDYEMDYINSRICVISGTTMVVNTAHLIDYTKSKLGIDVSAIIPVITKVVGVEYPVDSVPQTFVSYNIWNKFLYIGSQKVGGSQTQLSDGEHIAIYYERPHKIPNLLSPGSYEDFLDQVVTIGSSGYMLLTKAYQYEHQAATDLAKAREVLELEDHTAIATALDAAKAALATITTGLYTKVDVALDAIATAAGSADALHIGIATANDSANAVLNDVASLFTEIETSLDAMVTALGEVGTYLTGGSAPSTLKYLGDGDAFLNTINVGANVPENHAIYAMRSTEIANALIAEAQGFGIEAARRLDRIGQKISESNGYLSESMARQNEIDRRVAEANMYGLESTNRLAEVSRMVEQSNGYITEAQARLLELDRYVADSDRYITSANSHQTLADRFRAEGQARLAEFQRILSDRSEYRKRISSVALRQNP